jgi:predicted molibdopterin-dependent oxidoreductase YjgC
VNNLRIFKHPILEFSPKPEISFFYDGAMFHGIEGDTIASALHAAGVKKLSESLELHRPRGFYCAIGNCSSCHMTVNGIPNVKTCITPLEEGMRVESQTGKGTLK